MYKSAIIAFSALATMVAAQSIPTCAQSCITLPSQCNLDPKCICTDATWISDISCCVYKSCDQAGQQAALAYAQTICTPVGATLPSEASCSNSTSSSTSSGSSSVTSSASSSVSSAMSSASSSASGVSSSAASAASSASSSAAQATSSAFGVQAAVPAFGGVVGAVLGAVALL